MYPAKLKDIESVAVRSRVAIERRIVNSLISEFLSQGFKLAVDDGEAESDAFTTRSQVVKAIMETDEDYLIVYHANGKFFGAIRLVYGNDGWDVMSDWHTCLDANMPKTLALVEKLS